MVNNLSGKTTHLKNMSSSVGIDDIAQYMEK